MSRGINHDISETSPDAGTHLDELMGDDDSIETIATAQVTDSPIIHPLL